MMGVMLCVPCLTLTFSAPKGQRRDVGMVVERA
jgi:hypothetical protein